MTGPPPPVLVVIVGAIASGKSTLAAEVGRRLRERGEPVAVVGLDAVAEMALPTQDWSSIHEVHGQLVRAWLSTPVHTVVAEGPSTSADLDQLMRCVSGDVEVLTVVLTTPYATALKRALQEPDRGLSKDPVFLRADHDRFESSRRHLRCDLTLDRAVADPPTLAEQVLHSLDSRRHSNHKA
jgi:hypothetical protein